MGEARPHRVFFALWPDAVGANRLAALARDVAAGGGRAMHASTLHLTLAFIGAVSPVRLAELEEIATKVRGEAFDLCLDRIGCFPRGGIAWAGCSQEPSRQRRLFQRLHEALRGAGFAVDVRSGQLPHVTLARRARCFAPAALDPPICWRVAEFSLVDSRLLPTAANYRVLARYPLAAGEGD